MLLDFSVLAQSSEDLWAASAMVLLSEFILFKTSLDSFNLFSIAFVLLI